ncbi:unnamed protein product [Urochloa humidicola]
MALSDLLDDLLDRMLLRLSPENLGQCCKRASLVCKSWHYILSDPGFRRCYVDLHREEINRHRNVSGVWMILDVYVDMRG